jgi:uncharacterized protein YycO
MARSCNHYALAFGLLWVAFIAPRAYAQSDLPLLSPTTGGISINFNALQPGDIILSTTEGWGSAAIRELTGGGDASHARLYIGNEMVVEAVWPKGVRGSSLPTVLENDKVAIAVRKPGLSDQERKRIVQYAIDQTEKEYDTWGAFAQVRLNFNGTTWQPDLQNGDNERVYCSRLLIDAYRSAGSPLLLTEPRFDSPNDIVPLQWFGELKYVGHLKY